MENRRNDEPLFPLSMGENETIQATIQTPLSGNLALEKFILGFFFSAFHHFPSAVRAVRWNNILYSQCHLHPQISYWSMQVSKEHFQFVTITFKTWQKIMQVISLGSLCILWLFILCQYNSKHLPLHFPYFSEELRGQSLQWVCFAFCAPVLYFWTLKKQWDDCTWSRTKNVLEKASNRHISEYQ